MCVLVPPCLLHDPTGSSPTVCRQLTDMTIIELAGLKNLRRLSVVRIQKLTDNAIFFLAEHATVLEHLDLSYCDRISLDAVFLLLRKVESLQHLSVTGVPSFRRKGVERFSDPPPSVRFLRFLVVTLIQSVIRKNYDEGQRAAFRVYGGDNIRLLRKFLDKEEKRRRDAEAQSLPFVPRSDDKMDLY